VPREETVQSATPIGLAALARMAVSGVDLEPLKRRLHARLRVHHDDAAALMDLSMLSLLAGDREAALTHQAQALRHRQIYRRPPAAPSDESMRVLAFVTPGDFTANTPVELLLEESDVTLDLCYLTSTAPLPETFPEHDVAFVAIGESDETRPILRSVARLTHCWSAPVLNAPERLLRLARDAVWAHLASAPGVTMPMTVRVERQTLARIASGAIRLASVLERGELPIVVRPVGSRGGQGLAKLDDPAAITAYLRAQPDTQFHVSPFIDHRGADGLFRKYRVLLVADRPLACHMAVSESWMVPYVDAGASAHPETRAEEVRFMASFDDDFARRHAAAFRAIAERLGLDYFGIDCSETRDGDLLIFDVANAMLAPSVDPYHAYPCKAPRMRAVAEAFREMLHAARRAAQR
jgi:glutathione synthase/RimK-type ligase-like ATP-grasp enzyme